MLGYIHCLTSSFGGGGWWTVLEIELGPLSSSIELVSSLSRSYSTSPAFPV